MRFFFTPFLILLGLGTGYFLWGNQKPTVIVVKEPVKEIYKPTEPNMCLIGEKPLTASCDYSEYQKEIDIKNKEIVNLKSQLLKIPATLYVERPVEVIIKQPASNHLVYVGLGYGVKGVDVKTTDDGSKVYGVPRKGIVGELGYMYRVPEFSIPFTNKKVDGLRIGAGVSGAETQKITLGWDF